MCKLSLKLKYFFWKGDIGGSKKRLRTAVGWFYVTSSNHFLHALQYHMCPKRTELIAQCCNVVFIIAMKIASPRRCYCFWYMNTTCRILIPRKSQGGDERERRQEIKFGKLWIIFSVTLNRIGMVLFFSFVSVKMYFSLLCPDVISF